MNIPAAILKNSNYHCAKRSKLKFNSQVLAQGDQEWNEYLEALGIASKQAIRLVTEAALLGSAIEHGVSPELIVLSDGAKQF